MYGGCQQRTIIVEHFRRNKPGRAALLDHAAVRHELGRVLARTQELDAAVERHGDAAAGARGNAGRHIAKAEDQAAMCHAKRVHGVLRHLDLHDARAVTDLREQRYGYAN